MNLEELVSIKFDINGEMLTTPNLLEKKYNRAHIIQLFEELHKKGYGIYTPGKRGKGCFSRFVPNENCPKTYTLFAAAKGTRTAPKPVDIVGLPEDIACKISSENKKVEPKKVDKNNAVEKTEESQVLHALWGLSKNLVQDIMSDFIGYKCSIFADQMVVLHRVRGGGKETIEEAVKDIMPAVKDRILTRPTKNINKMEYIVSTLAGTGFIVLCPNGCSCAKDL